MCLQIPSKVKVTLGKSCRFLPVLKYLVDVSFFSPTFNQRNLSDPTIQGIKLVWPSQLLSACQQKNCAGCSAQWEFSTSRCELHKFKIIDGHISAIFAIDANISRHRASGI
jgi:hypothetical protein